MKAEQYKKTVQFLNQLLSPHKKTVQFLNQFDTDLDLVYQYENGISFDEYEQRVLNSINYEEIIYYHKAIDYLKENDSSLFESLSIASDYGYDVESLNSELLATLLHQQNLRNEWSEISQEIEEHFEENNY